MREIKEQPGKEAMRLHSEKGIVTFMVFALMGFAYDSAPTPSQVASSLQIRRSKLRHSHEGDNTLRALHEEKRL